MLSKSLDQFNKFLVLGIIILIGQKLGAGKSIVKGIPGIIVVLAIGFLALKIREYTPNLKFPAFAWACMIALILSMPFMPTSKIFLEFTNRVDFLGTATPILAFAGISVGNKVTQLKKISWKVFIIAILVFCGTFFGSATIAHMVLKMQGLI